MLYLLYRNGFYEIQIRINTIRRVINTLVLRKNVAIIYIFTLNKIIHFILKLFNFFKKIFKVDIALVFFKEKYNLTYNKHNFAQTMLTTHYFKIK